MHLTLGSHENRTTWFETWSNNVLRFLGDHFGAVIEARFIEPLAAEDYFNDPNVPERMQRMRRRQVAALHEIARDVGGNRRIKRRAVIFPAKDDEITEP